MATGHIAGIVTLGLCAAIASCAMTTTAPRAAREVRAEAASARVEAPVSEEELEITWNPTSRVLDGIRVLRGGETVRELQAHPEVVVLREDDYVAKQIDYDGDGRADLVVYRSASPAESYVLVWPFDAALGALRDQPDVYWRSAERPIGVSGGRSAGILRHVKDAAGRRTDIVIFGQEGIRQVIHHEGFALFSGDDWGGDLDPSTDVDFDGAADLVLLRGPCGEGCRYDFYRFDPARGRFAFAPELSALSAPVIDRERREVREFESRAPGGLLHRAARYRFAAGRLEKIWESEQTDALPRPPEAALTRTVRARVGDEMVIVCHALLDLDANVLKVLKGSLPGCAE